ncbi:MAG: TRAP transporter small permease subunit [Geminicoccaceae bacterium]|nr:MAG: TRAP transporter small permease subunit [Geminicoccaceae bacterium]
MRLLWRNLEELLSALVFLAMTGLGFANVMVRYLTNRSFAATEELLINGLLILTLLGAAIAAKRAQHLAVTVIDQILPGRLQLAVHLVATCLGVLLLVLAAWHTFELVQRQIASGVRSYALFIPAWYYTVGLPVGFVLVLIRFVERAVVDGRALWQTGARAHG